MAMLSILAMYNYAPEIFQDFRIPGRADITQQAETVPDPFVPDRQTALDYILTSCAELSLVYTKPDFLKFLIKSWTERRFPVWKALYNTMLYKYNPIWNKDGTIEEARNLTEEDDEVTTGTGSTTGTKTTTYTTVDDEDTSGHVESEGSTDADIRGNVTAYDTDSYSPNDQRTEDIGTTSEADHTGTRDLTRTENGSETSGGTSDSSGSRDRDRTEKENTVRREYGNIGVTMTQDMIQKERDISMFSLYELIKEDFKTEFCIMVY